MKNVTPGHEELLTCPGCGIGGFQPRGLKAHICKGAALAVPPAELFATARRLHEQAKYFGTASVASMVMCGVELEQLKHHLGFTRGGDRHSSKFQAETLNGTFEDLCRDYAGVSKATAYRYGLLAGAAAKKVKGLEAIITAAPGEVKDADRERVFKAVAKATDGYSAADVFDDWGLIPKPKPKLTAKQQAQADELAAEPDDEKRMAKAGAQAKRDKAEEDWDELQANLTAYGLKNRSFLLLSDEKLDALRHTLRSLLNLMGG